MSQTTQHYAEPTETHTHDHCTVLPFPSTLTQPGSVVKWFNFYSLVQQ